MWYESKIIHFDRELYKSLCEQMREVLAKEKELAQIKSQIRDEIIKQAGGDRVEYGLKVEHRISKGRIDYKKVAESLQVKEEYLERFRSTPQTAWYITAY